MVTTPFPELGRRLLANVDANQSDFAESMMLVPAAEYQETLNKAGAMLKAIEATVARTAPPST